MAGAVSAVEAERVRVWVADLDVPPERVAVLQAALDARERAAARRIRAPEARARFVADHGIRREILGAATGMPPDQLAFAYGPYGKPALMTSTGRPPPHFSASRSGRISVTAVGGGNPIGVDVERVRPRFDFAEIVKTFFAPEDCGELLGLPLPERAGRFFAIWTRYEACVKARGRTLAAELDGVEPAAAPTWVRPVAVAPGYAAALAGDGAAPEVTVAAWAPGMAAA